MTLKLIFVLDQPNAGKINYTPCSSITGLELTEVNSISRRYGDHKIFNDRNRKYII